jgi:hypothetical protein
LLIQRYEQKVFRIAALTNEVKKLRFVDRRSQLMKLKNGIDCFTKDEERNLPSTVPPIKIKVKKKKKTFLKKKYGSRR